MIFTLNEDLAPIERVELGGLCDKYFALAQWYSNSKTWDFGEHMALALTGHYHSEVLQHKCLKITWGSAVIDPTEIDQSADVDSVIGWLYPGDPFPLLPDHSIFLHTLNNFEYTLTYIKPTY